MRGRSLVLAVSLLLPGLAFSQAQPRPAPAPEGAAPGGAAVVLARLPNDWRALQGTHVRIAAPLTLVDISGLERHGQLVAAFGGRLWQPSEVAATGTAGHAQMTADAARRRLVLQVDGTNCGEGRMACLAPDATLRGGMLLRGVEGRVNVDAEGRPTLVLDQVLDIPAPQRPAAPQVAGGLKVAAFNLENYFNGDGQGGGFPTLRGARTLEEYRAQREKLLATILPLDADVAALMELENDGYGPHSAIADLVAALNAHPGSPGDWRFVDAGQGPGDNPIRVGIIYRSRRVHPLGAPAVLAGGPFAEHSRVPLAQAFQAGEGKPFLVVANHFKSKGCGDAKGADADQGDGQGCWNATRVVSAEQLDAWVRRDPTGTGTHDAVLLGDFNAYAMEGPLRALHTAGWRDAFAVARVQQPYSYVYKGYSGRLDHALLNAGMAERLAGAVEWHINADEMEASGYRQRNTSGPWRSSDHDPLLLGFDR